MQLTTLLTTAFLALTAHATSPPDAPAPATIATADLSLLDATSELPGTLRPPLSKRLPANFREVVYCADANRRGQCQTDRLRSSVCYNVARGWNDRISSLYPGRGTYCMAYDRADCDARRSNVMVSDPGAWDLKMLGMNDKISSLKCVQYG